LGELQSDLVAGDDVVAPNGAFGFHAQSPTEIDATAGNERDGGISRWPAELAQP
jgi:hypothetical protein